MSEFQFKNYENTPPKDLPTQFTLTAPPNTDIWSKPPSTRTFNAPILHRTMPKKDFHKARVAVQAHWKTNHDHAGLILVLPQKDGNKKWITAGVLYKKNDKAAIATVAQDRWSDWARYDLPKGPGRQATVEMERRDNGLNIYYIEGVQRNLVRKVPWAFEDEEGECWIGVYAAKPHESKDGKSLEVTFDHLVIE